VKSPLLIFGSLMQECDPHPATPRRCAAPLGLVGTRFNHGQHDVYLPGPAQPGCLGLDIEE
jgi:hypothetical protein